MELLKEVYSFASYSLFRKLASKKDISDVLLEFVNLIIVENVHEHNGEITVILVKKLLKDDFDFEIPYSVVNQLMRKSSLLEKLEKDTYILSKEIEGRSSTDFIKDVKKEIETEVDVNNDFVKSLVTFIESSRKCILDEQEIKEVVSCLYRYLLEKGFTNSHQDNVYSEYISAYLIGENSKQYSEQISSIREGSLIMLGLSYTDQVARQKKWIHDFDIYIEMEVLFHLAGYNGLIYQEIAKDTFNLIKEVNSKKKIINLYILESVENNIDRYFDAAINVFEKDDIVPPNSQAMSIILKDCKEVADIHDKKYEFFKLLEKEKIETVADVDVTKDTEFNISSSHRMQKYSIEESRDLDLLTHINKIRKGKLVINLVDAKAIILTERRIISEASLGVIQELSLIDESDSKNNYFVPYHINLWKLSARLWFDLDKGFGNGLPKSIDIVSKAKSIISENFNIKVSNGYEEVSKNYQNGTISLEDAENKIAYYKSSVVLAEDIDEHNVGEYLELLNNERIDFAEQVLYKKEEDLKQEKMVNANHRVRISDLESERDKVSVELSERDKTLMESKLEIDRKNKILRSEYDNKLQKCEKWEKIAKYSCDFFLVGIVLIFMGWLIYKGYTNHLNDLMVGGGIVLTILGFSVERIREKTISKRFSQYVYKVKYNKIDEDLKKLFS